MDQYHNVYGIELICKVTQIAPSEYQRDAACQRMPEFGSARKEKYGPLKPQAAQVWQTNTQV